MTSPETFGLAIAKQRKTKQMSQKDLAYLIKREDGESISPQYLNDIEHDRRSPSSELMIQQFAEVLDLSTDVLYFLAGKFPADLVKQKASPETIQEAMVVFRRTIQGIKNK